MDDEKDTYKKQYKDISVKTTDGSTLTGKVNLGAKERVSDLFTKTETPFIVLSDAKHKEGSGKILFINKANIVWVEPLDRD